MHHFKLSQHHMVVWIFCIEEFIMLVTLNITITFKTSIEVLYILRYLILSHWKKLPWSIKTFKQTAWIDEFNHYQTSLCIHIWKTKGSTPDNFQWANSHGTLSHITWTKKCVYRLQNSMGLPRKVWLPKSVTTGQTDKSRTKWSLCAAMFFRQHKNQNYVIWCKKSIASLEGEQNVTWISSGY